MKSWGKSSLLMVGCVLAVCLVYWQGGFAAWYLGICLLLIWLQAGLFYVFALQGLAVSRHLSSEVLLSGEEVKVRLSVNYRARMPLPWIVMRENWVHEGSGAKLSYSKLLFPWFQSELVLHYKITGLMRGVYRFAGFEAVSGDLFGFAIRKVHRDDLHRCVVYPRPASLDRSVMMFQAEDGEVPTARGPKSETPLVSGVREYVSGDPYHRIHWKSTARLSRLMVKDPEQASSAKRMLLLDAAPAAGPAEAAQPLLEKGVALAAGFFEAAAGGRESCGFASSSNSRRIAPTIRPDLPLAYEVLASVGGKPALSFPDLVRKEAAALPLDTSMLCITSTLDLALVRAIADSGTRRRSVHVIYVHARPSLSVAEREGASQLQAAGCSFTEVPHPLSQWPKQGGVADATA
ncbi:hypothetical protein GCM10008018_47460 [Paenibacillus marchantiophytorum]|uniref:DUF58 domain-containing protein n=1 Tax=Paenibacillus marchantiophytorum TaxID=1619310 RepID=A0ABQ1F194_9BACL|nr:DUF58 domain-containing protein [Paenibacillus marchantiophytorum]GFZ95615.1 hypothetical protein GCM10008018_47460 [Paenibacillus marchantiophytorum]